MIEVIQQKLQLLTSAEEKYNQLREFLQHLILKIVDENGYFRNLAFVGGTALRILYGLKRFSEDCDFCLVDHSHYDFSTIMHTLERHLQLYHFDVEIRFKDHKNVASAFIKFDNILYLLGLTQHIDKKLLIKFEVDQHTPKGYQTELSVINQDFLIGINHFDLPSLFAGKLHAVLCRKYAKGRDYYDLIWYISQKIQPNFVLLNNAVQQTEHQDWHIDKDKLSCLLKERMERADFSKIRADVTPFLMDSKEARFFEKKYFLSLIG